MYKYIFAVIIILTLVNGINAHVDGAKLEEECKIADICRHDQVPICGIDSCGEMRTFIDTCDMHEFNCDSKKVFTATRCPIMNHVRVDGALCSSRAKASLREPKPARFARLSDFTQKPTHECWVTCKRGRSFKKPLYRSDCNVIPI